MRRDRDGEPLDFDDRELAETIFSPVCSLCRRLSERVWRRCEAFKDKEIPQEIWEGENDHTGPWPGDGGRRFLRA